MYLQILILLAGAVIVSMLHLESYVYRLWYFKSRWEFELQKNLPIHGKTPLKVLYWLINQITLAKKETTMELTKQLIDSEAKWRARG